MLTPPNPERREVFLGGPIKPTASRGGSLKQVTDAGMSIVTTGASKVKQQRPLLTVNGQFFDEECGQYLPLEGILEEFLDVVPEVVAEFESLLKH